MRREGGRGIECEEGRRGTECEEGGRGTECESHWGGGGEALRRTEDEMVSLPFYYLNS